MRFTELKFCAGLVLLVIFIFPPIQVLADELAEPLEDDVKDESVDKLIKEAENPLAEKIAITFENSLSLGIDPGDTINDQLRIKMLFPTKHGDWWLAHRPVLPVFYKEEIAPGEGSRIGLGDLSYRLYFSPRKEEDFNWGIGPAFVFPTATSPGLGLEKWCIGPTVAVMADRGKWTLGVAAHNVWSFSGASDRPSVNVLTVVPLFNYSFGGGWLISSTPEIIANWNADKDNRWLVPIGGSVGKVFKIKNQPIAVTFSGYYNVERPTGAPEYEARISFHFVFKRIMSRLRERRKEDL